MVFAIGREDLGHTEPRDAMRRIIGLFVLDALEYSEQWRAAAIARAQLEQKWSECAAFQVANGEAEEN